MLTGCGIMSHTIITELRLERTRSMDVLTLLQQWSFVRDRSIVMKIGDCALHTLSVWTFGVRLKTYTILHQWQLIYTVCNEISGTYIGPTVLIFWTSGKVEYPGQLSSFGRPSSWKIYVMMNVSLVSNYQIPSTYSVNLINLATTGEQWFTLH